MADDPDFRQGPAERRRKAVALSYGEGEAPRVVAQGYGELAERIIAEARRNGLYVHESPQLTALLMELELDQQIPPALFDVVAEILVWIDRIQNDPPST